MQKSTRLGLCLFMILRILFKPATAEAEMTTHGSHVFRPSKGTDGQNDNQKGLLFVKITAKQASLILRLQPSRSLKGIRIAFESAGNHPRNSADAQVDSKLTQLEKQKADQATRHQMSPAARLNPQLQRARAKTRRTASQDHARPQDHARVGMSRESPVVLEVGEPKQSYTTLDSSPVHKQPRHSRQPRSVDDWKYKATPAPSVMNLDTVAILLPLMVVLCVVLIFMCVAASFCLYNLIGSMASQISLRFFDIGVVHQKVIGP